MGSVASTSNGLSDLLQTLTNENSPLLPTLSSPAIQAALENAPASDIVQISNQAMQLQDTEALFATSTTQLRARIFTRRAIGSPRNRPVPNNAKFFVRRVRLIPLVT